MSKVTETWGGGHTCFTNISCSIKGKYILEILAKVIVLQKKKAKLSSIPTNTGYRCNEAVLDQILVNKMTKQQKHL